MITLRALRRNLLVLLVCAIAGALAALALSDAQPGYRATAEVVISPLPETDDTLLGVSVLRDSRESARAIQTAAALLHSEAAAERAARVLRVDPIELYDDVKVDIVGESNVLAVTASAATPRRAAQAANEFARAAVAVQQERVAAQAAAALKILRDRLDAVGGDDPTAASLNARITALEALRASGGDPTIALGQSAALPRVSTGPPTPLVLLLGALVGLVVGVLVAIVRERATRKVNDERVLTTIYPLSVLARVPLVRPARRMRAALQVPPRVREAFRAAVAQLERRREDGKGRVVLVIGAAGGDGATTAVACIGEALAEAGFGVVTVDADLRAPRLGAARGVAEAGARNRDGDLESQLAETGVPGLHVLPAAPADPAELLVTYRRFPALLGRLREEFEWVIVDAPALGEVSDALRLLGAADEVLLVCRLGNTTRAKLRAVSSMLANAGTAPMGVLLVGASMPQASRDEELRPVDAAVR